MKLVIGIATCGRFNFLEQVLDTLYKHNEDLIKYPLIIADDASDINDVTKMLAKWPYAHIVHSSIRLGANANFRKMYEYAEKILLADLLMGLVNDFICTRKIDIEALINFFDEPTVGQLQFIHWKGKIGDPKRERANKNWTTGESIKKMSPINIGKEELVEGNWSYNDIPHIIRLNQTDICGSGMKINAYGDSKKCTKMELLRVKNWYNTGLRNFEIQDQAFFNLDWDFGKRTKGLKA